MKIMKGIIIVWLKEVLDSKNNISDVQKRIIAGVFICIYETKGKCLFLQIHLHFHLIIII